MGEFFSRILDPACSGGGVAGEEPLGLFPLKAVLVERVAEDFVGELGPRLGVAGAEGFGDPFEVGGWEGAQHFALVFSEIYDSVCRRRDCGGDD